VKHFQKVVTKKSIFECSPLTTRAQSPVIRDRQDLNLRGHCPLHNSFVTALRSNTFDLCHGTRFLKSRHEIFSFTKAKARSRASDAPRHSAPPCAARIDRIEYLTVPSDGHPGALHALSSFGRKKTSVANAKKNHAGRNAASFAHRRRAAARFVTGFSVTRPWNSMSEWSQDGMLLNGARATRRAYPSACPTRATRTTHPFPLALKRSRSVLRLHDEAEGHPRVPHRPGAECRARFG
jgi:hypothetical protein